MKAAVVFGLLVATAMSSFANEASDELANRTPYQSVLSRQAVQDAYLAARKAGTLPVTSEAASLQTPTVPENDEARAEARRQALEAARQRVIHELM
ncbi:hypothetical protein [Ramlibacter sp.]|uniref:hypothetical protein n=1 Tax=Ramlibacter sp. TaxID=1917967 RepID=UPI002FC62DBC